MPAAARGNGVDSVLSQTGSGPGCAFPLNTTTDECSGDVFVNGIGIVRQGDRVKPHAALGCTPIDQSPLTTFSPTVFINSKGAGRLGDQYTSDNTITSGSPNTFVGP